MKEQTTVIFEHILEIRHQPSGKFLDIKGTVADEIRNSKMFTDWQVDSNTIRTFNNSSTEEKKDEAFVGFNSIRFMSRDPSTRNYFYDKSTKFIKIIKDGGFYKVPDFTRVGVRTRYYVKSNLEFKAIYNKIYELFFKDNLDNLIGKTKTDFLVAFDIQEDDFDVKLRFGPLRKNEASIHFGFKSEAFNQTGIFFDIDCSKVKDINIGGVDSLIKKAMGLTWQKIDNITVAVGI